MAVWLGVRGQAKWLTQDGPYHPDPAGPTESPDPDTWLNVRQYAWWLTADGLYPFPDPGDGDDGDGGDDGGDVTFLIQDLIAYADTDAFQAAIADPSIFDHADLTARYENVIVDESVHVNGHHSLSVHSIESARTLYKQFQQADATAAVWIKWSQVIPADFLAVWMAKTSDRFTTAATRPALAMVTAFSDDYDASAFFAANFVITGGATPVVELRLPAATNWGAPIPDLTIHHSIPLANWRDSLSHDFAMLAETKYNPATQACSLRIRAFQRVGSSWTLLSELVQDDASYEEGSFLGGPISSWPCFGWQVALGDEDGNDVSDDDFIDGSTVNWGDLQVVDALLFPDPFSIGATPDPDSSSSDPVTFTLEPIVINTNNGSEQVTFATAVNKAGQDVSGAAFIIDTQFVVEDPIIASVSSGGTNETGGGFVTTITALANGLTTVNVRLRPAQDPGNSPEIFYGPSVPLTITITNQT